MWTRAFLITAALAAVLVGGAEGAAAADLRVDSQGGPGSIDPAVVYDLGGWQLEYATCLQLVNYPDGGSAAPALEAARSLRVDSSGRVYRFQLRRNLWFSSGERVTGQSFAHELARLRDPALGSPGASFFADVIGVRASTHSIRFTLAAPRGDFLARLATPFMCAVPVSLPDPPGGVGAPLPSAGPYYVASYAPGSQIVLQRNPLYGGTRPHDARRIVYTLGVDPATSEARIIAGQADYAADGLPVADYQAIDDAYGPGSPAAQAGHQQFFVNPLLSTFYLALNTSRPALASPLARMAINEAIDRPALTAAAGAFGGSVTDQILPPGMPGYSPVAAYPLTGPDVAAAWALAERAGLVGQTLVLYTSTSQAGQARAAIVAQDLAAIGVDVAIDSFPRSEQIARDGTRGEPFDMSLEGWGADYADPADFFGTLLDGTTIRAFGNADVSYFDDPAFNAQIEADATLRGPARSAAYATLDEAITGDAAPWAAFQNGSARDFVSALVHHEVFQPLTGLDLAALRVG